MTLVEFLLERIAEDEAVAERLRGGPGGDPWGWQPHGLETCDKRRVDYPPARVLAECEAKWRIVEDHNAIHAGCPGAPTLTSDDGEQDGTYGGPCAVLRNLASVYADHPSYREAWRP